MTTCHYLTKRQIPFTLDSYECRSRWHYRAAMARDSVSSDGSELTFGYGCPKATAFRAGRNCGHLTRAQAGAAAQAYTCCDEFIRGWSFAQRWSSRSKMEGAQ